MSPKKKLIPLRFKLVVAYVLLFALALAVPSNQFLRSFVRSVLADTSPQTIPFSQNWTNNGLITANDNWSGVPGVEGYLGQDITTATGTDPQTLLGTSSVAGDLTVLANQTATTVPNGDVGEFHTTSQAGAPGTDSTIALQGSGTADAPYVLLYLNTTGQTGVNVAYNLRDIDCTTDNAVQAIALQYRVGNSGNFTNVAAGFIADATTGPSLCTLVTPVSVTLPVAVENQALVQVRIMTTNAGGNDEWVGVDDVSVTSGAGPAPTTLNIGDVTQAEGNAGTSTFSFPVTLTAPAPAGGVSFTVNTADGTTNPANSGSDYVAIVGGSGSIAATGTSTTVNVTVNGDLTIEPNETFFVNITGVTGATPGDSQGLGTITNDDVVITPIHDIQGSGSSSPLVSNVVTTTGFVTGLRSNGFFLQTPAPDANSETSEGIFVFTSSAPPAAAVIGNSVNVTGTVQEFIPSADPTSPPTTELVTPSVSLLSTGNPLPAPIAITASETTQASETSNPMDSLEEYEGMRVTVASLTVTGATQGSITETSATVASTGIFIGVVTGVPRPFREAGIAISDPVPAPNPANVPRFDENPERIRVDSDAQPGTTAIDVAAGTVITNITGPLDYAFRVYTILPDAATPPVVGAQPGSVAVPAPTADELTIASFNMERFFDTVNDPPVNPNIPVDDPVLSQAAFDRRVAKASLIIRTIQRYPDVIGVEEMEHLSTLQAVAAKINADAVADGQTPNYQAYLVEGNDLGGIDVGFLVKESRVTRLSVTQLELPGCDHITPSTCYNYVDPNTGGLDIMNDRPPLVLLASIPRTAGGVLGFTVIVNHLRSLNSIDDNTVAGTGTVGARVREKRRQEAEFLANYIQGRQTANPNEKIITLGDLNAFRVNDGFVDSIGTILGTPAPANQVVLPSADLVNPNQTDLVDTLPAAQQYSYNFDGNTQTLDHLIVNPPALAILSRFAYARNDSDFAVKNYESTNELRISDHDQPVAYFSLTAPTAANGIVSGRITDAHGFPLAGAVLNLSGTQNRKFITDANGNYRFENVETNGFYTVRPSLANFTFSPAEKSFTQLANSTEAAFTGVRANGSINPLDTPEYFVRQHYLDFLGREPDENGFNFWGDQILACGSDTACVERRTINVSAAYFLSIEFQQTGGLVDQLYRASYNRRPLFAEFMPDTATVAQGVAVGAPDWAQRLAANKQAFLAAWVQRAEFQAAYGSLTNESYLDTLISHAGGFNGDREALARGLGNGSLTRVDVLRQIAENDGFANAKRNERFVMMQYFGYLRRDPDENGYRFWINKLTQFDGNFEQAEMVKAFLVSGEYRNRFSN